MRRIDREMPAEFALEVADKCEWAVMSMIDPKGMPYCIPISIVRDDNNIYFHSAKEGFKVECLRANLTVCIACVGDTKPSRDKFTTEFESAIIRGVAMEVLDDKEKIKALRILCEKLTPTNMDEFDGAIAKSLFRTAVWKVEINEITGKRKKYDEKGEEMKFGRMDR